MSAIVHASVGRLPHLLVAVVCVLGFSSPLSADGIPHGSEKLFVDGSEEVFITAEELELLTALRKEYLKLAEQLIRPCLRKDDVTCQASMIEALDSAARYARPGARASDLLAVIRNGQFRYQTAFALRLLNSIIRQGGVCSDLEKRATAKLKDGTPLNLGVLLATARSEIRARNHPPEARLLTFVEDGLQKAKCQPIIAANDSVPLLLIVER